MFPFPITSEDLARGQRRFNIYCSPCHSRIGDGNGMIVRRGFRQAASYHTERLIKAPIGHFFDVMTNGFGAMPSYASRVEPDDRWRIVAYIRVLQLSENAAIDDVPPKNALAWRLLRDDNDLSRNSNNKVAAHVATNRHRGWVVGGNWLASQSRAGFAVVPIRLSLLAGNGVRFDGDSMVTPHGGRKVGNADPAHVRGRMPHTSIYGDPSDSGAAEYPDTVPLGETRRRSQSQYPG